MKGKSNFLELYLHPATRQNLVEPIYPDKPKYPRRNTVLLKSYAEIKCARDEKRKSAVGIFERRRHECRKIFFLLT